MTTYEFTQIMKLLAPVLYYNPYAFFTQSSHVV